MSRTDEEIKRFDKDEVLHNDDRLACSYVILAELCTES